MTDPAADLAETPAGAEPGERGSAHGGQAEVTCRGRVRSRDWVRVSRGVYRARSADSDWLAEIRGWQLTLPADGCFTHLSAALIRGWMVPPLPIDLPTFAAIRARDPRPRRAGLVVSRHPRAVEHDVLAGLRVARAPEALLAAATDLGVLDLVVLIDSALHQGHCTVAEIRAILGRRRRGGPALGRALAYADGRSESAWESLLRVFHQLCEVPVEPQFRIDGDGRPVTGGVRAASVAGERGAVPPGDDSAVPASDGSAVPAGDGSAVPAGDGLVLASLRGDGRSPTRAGHPGAGYGGGSPVGSYRADLRIVGTRRLAEYDGALHRAQHRHAQDLDRERDLHRLGWQRYGYTAGVLLHRSRSILRDADDALGRPHEPSRIRPWHAALAESLFSTAGSARLRARWAVRANGDRSMTTELDAADVPVRRPRPAGFHP